MQRVEIVYNIVYVKVPRHVSRGSVGGGLMQIHGANLEELKRLEKKLAKAQKAQRTNKAISAVMDTIQKILHLIRIIPSAGIQRMLMHGLNAAMHQLKAGDVTGAANSVTDLLAHAEKCKELCDAIMGNIMKLRHGGGVTGPAQQALFNLSFAAEKALNHAGSLDTLMLLKGFTDSAVQVMNKLATEKPGTKEYEALMGALANLTQDITLLGQEEAMKEQAQTGGANGAQGPGMAQDTNEIVGGLDALIENAIRQGRRKQRDPNELKKLDALGDALRGALQAGRDNDGDMGTLGQDIQQLLGQALEGNIDGALQGANQLCESQARIGKLQPTLDAKLDRLSDACEGLNGPAAKTLQQLHDALKHDCAHCKDPEAMIALDAEMGRCLDLAAKLSKLPPGEQMRCPEYRQLLIIMRKRCQPSESPLGRDRFGTAPLKAPGTKRLEEDQWVIPSLDHLEKKHPHHPKDELVISVNIEEIQHPHHHHHHHPHGQPAAGKDLPSPGKDLPSPGKDLPSPGKDLPSPVAKAGKAPAPKEVAPPEHGHRPSGVEIDIEIDILVERSGKGHHHHHHHDHDVKADATTAIGGEAKRLRERPDELAVLVAQEERLRHHHARPAEPPKLGRPAKIEKPRPDAPEIDDALAAIVLIEQGKPASPGT